MQRAGDDRGDDEVSGRSPNHSAGCPWASIQESVGAEKLHEERGSILVTVTVQICANYESYSIDLRYERHSGLCHRLHR
jgi:hypothetical protein